MKSKNTATTTTKTTEKGDKIYENATITKHPKAKVEVTATLPAHVFSTYRAAALKNINEAITIDGFRQGNVPEKILVTKVGEKAVLEEMAELAISDVYPVIMFDNKIDAIGRPEVSITKMALDNPLEFKIVTAVVPEITLGDYKKIAKETPLEEKVSKKVKKGAKDATTEGEKAEGENENVELSEEKEIDEAIARIKKSHEADGADHTGHDHGNFESPEFREKVKAAIIENKRLETIEKRRIAMADKIVAESTVELPSILVDNEINRIEAQFKEDIARMGVTLDDYLKHAKKSLEDLRKEWAPHAEKKAKLQLVLNKIADIENIRAEEKEIEAEVNHLLEHYKDADKERAYAYAAGVLTNEKVFQFLEEQK